MKPRANWVIAASGSSARRADGVTVVYKLSKADKPFTVQRPYISPRRGHSIENLRAAGSLLPRRFRTLEDAMIAADEKWTLA